MSDHIIYLDGEYVAESDAKISVFDHGLLYGDGIFEGIRVYNGRVFLLNEHIDRLYDSAKAIMMIIPMAYDDMKALVLETCRRNNIRNGYIRLVITRGKGSLGLSPRSCPTPSIICIAADLELYPAEAYEKGLKIVTVPTVRMGHGALSPAIKSLNYLNNIMAKMECQMAGADEAVMLNDQGYVAECSGDNIFVVKKGKIITPPISAGALDGITRRCAMDIIKTFGKPLEVGNLTRYDLFVADEIFLTGTGAEIVPVVSVDGRIIGDGTPGTVTSECMRRYRETAQTSGTTIPSS